MEGVEGKLSNDQVATPCLQGQVSKGRFIPRFKVWPLGLWEALGPTMRKAVSVGALGGEGTGFTQHEPPASMGRSVTQPQKLREAVNMLHCSATLILQGVLSSDLLGH